jgi:hypothetical protein
MDPACRHSVALLTQVRRVDAAGRSEGNAGRSWRPKYSQRTGAGRGWIKSGLRPAAASDGARLDQVQQWIGSGRVECIRRRPTKMVKAGALQQTGGNQQEPPAASWREGGRAQPELLADGYHSKDGWWPRTSAAQTASRSTTHCEIVSFYVGVQSHVKLAPWPDPLERSGACRPASGSRAPSVGLHAPLDAMLGLQAACASREPPLDAARRVWGSGSRRGCRWWGGRGWTGRRGPGGRGCSRR